jgi:hypothetical protein
MHELPASLMSAGTRRSTHAKFCAFAFVNAPLCLDVLIDYAGEVMGTVEMYIISRLCGSRAAIVEKRHACSVSLETR